MKVSRLCVAGAVLTATGFAADFGNAANDTPLWVRHVEQYPGGISNSVRFSLSAEVLSAQARRKAQIAAPESPGSGNVQMNDDSYPEVPQNEESVAYSLDNPMVAVAAANDYVS